MLTEIIVVLLGTLALVCAFGADADWLDRHFLPDFFNDQPHRHQVANVVRVLGAGLGMILLLLVRPRVGRAVAHGSWPAMLSATLRVVLATVLALLTSEAVLHTTYWQSRHESPHGVEPLQQRDERLGWVLVPHHAGRGVVGDHSNQYAFDSNGYRVPSLDTVVDPARPSILFTGESIMLGMGLEWDQSLPAQIASRLGLQSVNLAVNGYANDQAFLRLAGQLPRFSQPVAVVSLFMPALFVRNLDRDRAHLDAGLHWLPPRKPWRLEAIVSNLVRYNSDAEIERGVEMTRAVLRATAELAESRHARSMILVPQFGAETPAERILRRRILDEAGLHYVLVELDPEWRQSGDKHPDAHAMQVMAAAVAAQLQASKP